mgnify:FL=1
MSGARTISQIAGEHGLNRNSTKDPFAAQEKAVTDQVSKQLEESQSRQLESASSRGFGRSSFTEGAFAREREGVFGALGTEFARARNDESLRERGFERDIISNQLGADITSRQQTEAGTQQRLTLADQLAGESGFIGQRGEENRLTQDSSLQGQSGLLAQQQEFATQENQFGRQFSQQETQLQREFQAEFQKSGFQQQTTLVDQQRQDQFNQQALDLVLSGNISQDNVQEQIGNLLGVGAVLTNDDEATLQRMSAAAGLSVEDYTRLRSAIGTAQGETILGTHKGEITKTNEAGEELFLIGDNKTYDRLGVARGTELTPAEITDLQNEHGTFGTRPSTTTGDVSNISNFIQDPGAAAAFQMEMAKMQAKFKVKSAKENAKKVLCTELYTQGRLPFHIYIADHNHASKIDPYVVSGYHYWAKPLVKIMQRYELVTHILAPFITAWAYQMAYREDVVEKPNGLGRFLELVGMPLCKVIGKITNKELSYGRN